MQPAGDTTANLAYRTVARERKNLVDGDIEERAVVADDDDYSGPGLEVVLQCPECVEVEVVGGFVEKKNVRLLDEGEEQLQATTLATRQRADGGELRIAVEPETAHQVEVFDGRVALVADDGIAHALVRIEVAAELVVITDLHG